METIGGGSLKQRLNGGNISAYIYDSKINKLFLGSNDSEILIYDLTEIQPKFLKSFSINKKKQIECLLFKKGFILI